MIPLKVLTPNADQLAPARRKAATPPPLPSARTAEPAAPSRAQSTYSPPVEPVRAPAAQSAAATASSENNSDVNVRFEQMLWAEMLRHTGLEEAFSSVGGEGAAAFTQFAVEAIARDLAEKHPLGLNAVDRAVEAYEMSRTVGDT
ncbi:hypothetical protein D1224_05415 [Henriciella barbarensis]|uniref:Flagellar protein FlgJ N-terminal domain-containing protein n=1 Tax=Henriciella barbarensis TaxID=86342 RepID=A0A399QXN2_9PROT|nr:hypothetical protein [Henriciella barbarensis]RIJ23700.1 hypothetical protein D1224_05415 [Henriciella barbarensis]